PLVSSLKSFVRDSTFLIQQLQDLIVPSGVWLVDVESLYTCIRHDVGMQAVSFFLDQNKTGTLEDCQHFVELLNHNPWNIWSTSHFLQTGVEFPDLQLYPKDSRIYTTLYRKSKATNSLLHFSSFHPQHLRRGIPKGQFYRVKRNCSTQDDFRAHSQDLTHPFKNKGYPKKCSPFNGFVERTAQRKCEPSLTLEVNSLYTSISHEKGILANKTLPQASNMSGNSTQFCLDLLKLVLYENFFLYEDVYYIQSRGTTMGSNVAPTYANAFMSHFEDNHIYPGELLNQHVRCYHRYIDDIFVWTGSPELLLTFHQLLNSVYPRAPIHHPL
ncbi:unnamed protein product, partial [Ranitomeya imitator]